MNYKNIFSLCFNESDDLFILLSENLVILDINSSAEIILGWKKQDIYNQVIGDVFKKYRTKPFIENNKSVKLAVATTEVNYENNIVMINWKIIIVDHIENNNAILVVGKLFKQAANQLDNLLRYAPGLVYWKDTNSVYQGCNDEFARLAGLESRNQVIGKTDFDLAWKDGAPHYVADDQQVLKTRKSKLNIEEIVATS